MSQGSASLFGWISAGLVAVCVAVGLYLVGPPGRVRAERLDEARIQRLGGVVDVVEAFRKQKGALPDTLAAAYAGSEAAPSGMRDPVTGAPFEYQRTGPDTYRLCARFETASQPDAPVRWRHGPGRACFALESRRDAAARTSS